MAKTRTAKKDPHKKNRYSQKLVNMMNELLRKDMNDPRLKFVSITKVELSPDCAYAEVFWDSFDRQHRGDMKKALLKATGHMRKILADTLKVRHVPTITFTYDNQYEEQRKIELLLNKELEKTLA